MTCIPNSTFRDTLSPTYPRPAGGSLIRSQSPHKFVNYDMAMLRRVGLGFSAAHTANCGYPTDNFHIYLVDLGVRY